MKKGVPISLVFLLLAAMFRFSVATHYCGGETVATIVTLSGKAASCGMEDEKEGCPSHGTQLNSHCCDDVITSYTIDNNYTPAFLSIQKIFQYNSQFFSNPGELPVQSPLISKSLYTSVRPPGALMSSAVDLSDICVFRI